MARPRSFKAAPATARLPAVTIGRFARVSKHAASGKPKAAFGKDLAESIAASKVQETAIRILSAPPSSPPAPAPTPKKRKAEPDTTTSTAAPARAVKRLRPQTTTPDLHEKAPLTTQTGVLFERLNLQSPSSSPSSTPCKPNAERRLPAELVDLRDLHAALLKTLNLHSAHNGTVAPVDARALCPNIAQAWGKRKVTVEDLQRCVGILDMKTTPNSSNIFATAGHRAAASPFFLSDYGRGKVCIELHAHKTGGPGPVVSETRLGQLFESKLQAAWAAAAAAAAPKPPNVDCFLAGLPKAAIVKRDSSKKASPLLAKGQRTLEELKNGIVVMKKQQQQQQQHTEAGAPAATPPLNADSTKMSLLDRIRYKQLRQSLDAPPPSPAELARRAALQRAGDVAAVVAMLSAATATGQKRVSFTMATLQARLKDSLRVPISKEEGAACVRLLAKEIAPDWLKIVVIGARENVVLLTDFTPSKTAIQERVDAVST